MSKPTAFQEFQTFIQVHTPEGARAYRLVAEDSGQMIRLPAPPLPGLKVNPAELPLVASGQYLVSYEDQGGKVLGITPEPVNWVFPAKRVTEVAAALKAVEGEEGEDLRLSLEMEQAVANASNVRANAQYFQETLTLFRGFVHAMGTQSSHELTIKNEQINLLNTACSNLLKTQVELMDTFRQHAANLRTPPPPPQWDKIVAAAAPAFAAMYVETVQAIKGESRKTKGPSTADLLTPVDEKLSKLYDLLGNVASNDRLEVLLKDPEKLQVWMKSVQNFMSGEPKAEGAAE